MSFWYKLINSMGRSTKEHCKHIVCYIIRMGLCYSPPEKHRFGSDVGEMKKKDIPRMIKNLRTAMDLTQEQFAATVGVSWSTVSRWENGRGFPSPLAMRRIEESMREAKGQAHEHGHLKE